MVEGRKREREDEKKDGPIKKEGKISMSGLSLKRNIGEAERIGVESMQPTYLPQIRHI